MLILLSIAWSTMPSFRTWYFNILKITPIFFSFKSCYFIIIGKKASEYDQEIPQSHFAD